MPPATDLPALPALSSSRRLSPEAAAAATSATLRGGPWPLHARLQGLVLAVVLGCLLIGLGLQQWAAREALLRTLAREDSARAASLALALAREALDSAEQRDAVLGPQFEAAGLALLQLRDGEGRLLWQRRSEPLPAQAPHWYAGAIALEPGGAGASWPAAAGRRAGSVLVRGPTAAAVDALWQGLLESTLALVLGGGAVLGAAIWHLRRVRRALAEAVDQANALADGRWLRQASPALPELRPLAASMNLLADRVQALFQQQAAQAEQWRRQAFADPLTGLPLRRHFLAQFEQLLGARAPHARYGLLLLRVRDLQGMNRRIGHAAADQVLQTVAHTLASYPRRSDGCFAGRLNGADFALVLPVGGLAQDTAQALVQALRLPLVGLDAAASVALGAVELTGSADLRRALALADESLARAEADRPFGVHCTTEAGASAEALAYGEANWQQRLSQALEEGRLELAAYPVCSADGRVLHLDCPLRVQLEPGGAFEPAARWLAQAARARLCAQIDEAALRLALQAIDEDGLARCINFSAQSLAISDFLAAVSRRLEAAPQAATRLWIDLPESLALDHPALVQEAARRWRPLGVYLGLEHAGELLARMPHLLSMGLDCVRIDGRYLCGLAEADGTAARRYLQGLVQLVQGVGLSITAEGVRHEADLALLWRMGFDAATGPAVAVAQPMSATLNG